MRLSIDTGGTFTDLVLEDRARELSIHKTPSTPLDPIEGILAGVAELAERRHCRSAAELLNEVEVIVHGTTRATNAIIAASTATTAFLVTAGHPDVLLLRMGGRQDPFRHDREFPAPYVPRSLTFEIDERIDHRGDVVRTIDIPAVESIAQRLLELEIEAAGVCLLWSVVNHAHELAVGEVLARVAPGIAVTLSHEVNPVIREYHRASAACIDASLKPLMSQYLGNLRHRLAAAGFAGRLLVASASGGLLEPEWLAAAPIHSINSGPALAPVAGRHHAVTETGIDSAVIVDAGGTSFDVSVVRHGRIPRTRETWLGERFTGHITGFPSVDVRTTGAGGGSIASVDAGGLLTVGPQSAGSIPGPAGYGRGGTLATVTDAALVLGYLDGARLATLGLNVDRDAAARAIETHVGKPLGLDRPAAAEAVIRVLTEAMVHAIEEVTIEQGIDPRTAVLVSGGGASGFNVVAIAGRLGCRRLVIPSSSTALSATGGLMAPISAEHAVALFTDTERFDLAAVNGALAGLAERCRRWVAATGPGYEESTVEFIAEARYPGQVWELELPLRRSHFSGSDDVQELAEDFHRLHHEVFAVGDPAAAVEIAGWRARVQGNAGVSGSLAMAAGTEPSGRSHRAIHVVDRGWTEVPVVGSASLSEIVGPAILELVGTTIVLTEGATATRTTNGTVVVTPSDPVAARAAEALDVR